MAAELQAAAVAQEARLVKTARDYQDVEGKKGLRWFPFIGDAVPQPAEINLAMSLRAAALQAEAAALRQDDRHRTTVEKGKHAFVPAAEHPAYDLPSEQIPKLSFAPDAVSTVERKQALHASFTSALWTALARMRAERRINKMRSAQLQQASGDAPGVKSGRGEQKRRSTLKSESSSSSAAVDDDRKSKILVLPDMNLALLSMPAMPPARIGPSHNSAPSGGGSSGSVLANLMAVDPPSVAETDTFAPKELRVPWEFKLKHYAKFKFSDHHFATRDPVELIPNLPAGNAECVEAHAGQAPIPALSHFSQPLVTLETFPLYDFAFRRSAPQQGLVKGTLRYEANNGGFADPYAPTVDYGQIGVPSAAPNLDNIRRSLHDDALPKALRQAHEDDSLSDEEDEDPIELPKPVGLRAIAGTFLPPFGPVRPSTSESNVTPSQQQRMSSVGIGVGDISGEGALAFQPRPIHRTGTEQKNLAVLSKLQEAASKLDTVASKLPPTVRIIF